MEVKSTHKLTNILICSGGFLLLLPAGLHISGLSYVTEKMQASNAPPFLKEIMPILFALPSVHLLSLASFALFSIYVKANLKVLLLLVAAFVLINVVFAFYLAAYLPGSIMVVSCACFLLAAYYSTVRV